jgi:hypothetical protein
VNSHKNARLTVEGRKLLIERIAVMGLMQAAAAAGISSRTARKWMRRFEQEGLDGLIDRSSRPSRTRSTVDLALQRSIEQLRRLRMPNAAHCRARGPQRLHCGSLVGPAGAVQPQGA